MEQNPPAPTPSGAASSASVSGTPPSATGTPPSAPVSPSVSTPLADPNARPTVFPSPPSLPPTPSPIASNTAPSPAPASSATQSVPSSTQPIEENPTPSSDLESEDSSSTFVFSTDGLTATTVADREYFTNIITNPIIRFLLRTHIIKDAPRKPASPVKKISESETSEHKTSESEKPAPVVRIPQFRMTIRIAPNVIMKKKQHHESKVTITALLVLLFVAICAILYLYATSS